MIEVTSLAVQKSQANRNKNASTSGNSHSLAADSELKPAGIPINYRPPFRFEAGHDSNQLSAVFRL
jgi:hypothetical protein